MRLPVWLLPLPLFFHHHHFFFSHLSCNTMDSSESPFSNLDVWCDWNGDLKDPVEVTLSVEVSDTNTADHTLLTEGI